MIYPQWSIIPPRSTVHRTVMNRFIDTFICISNAWMKKEIKSSLRGVSIRRNLCSRKNIRAHEAMTIPPYQFIPLFLYTLCSCQCLTSLETLIWEWMNEYWIGPFSTFIFFLESTKTYSKRAMFWLLMNIYYGSLSLKYIL